MPNIVYTSQIQIENSYVIHDSNISWRESTHTKTRYFVLDT